MTIAQQLKVKNFPFRIKDNRGNEIYLELSDGFWSKREFNSNNNIIYSETSRGYWCKREFDSNNNKIYEEQSNGNWYRNGFDSNNNRIYYEDSNGQITDNRPKPVTELSMDEIAAKFNVPVETLKIKK